VPFNCIVRRCRIVPVSGGRVIYVLRVAATWTVVIVNMGPAILIVWAVVRQYGVSTAGSDGLMPTLWETGAAPYILVLLKAVLVSSISTASGYRYGRYPLMAVTSIYTPGLSFWGVAFILSMREAQAVWARIVWHNVVYFVVIIVWFLISYWSLLTASRPNPRSRGHTAASGGR
jgi:hypothetical protein